MMNNIKTLYKTPFIILIFSALTSCATIQNIMPADGETEVKEIEASQRLQISIPLPSNTKYITDKTIIFGEGSRFSGSLYLIHEQDVDEVVEFYRVNMRDDGWQEIAIVRSNFVLINFDKEDRFATIRINRGMFKDSSSEVTIGPKSSNIIDSGNSAIDEPFKIE